ncbi:MAG: cell wall metabolism sensor histidine kinase WalK, partial [Firmicutes bacterium]|nr:cell wall metabolism sensor histidine kinase WalK [Bacillota bacterium]
MEKKRKSSVLLQIRLGASVIGIIVSLAVGIASYLSARSCMLEEIRQKTVDTATVAASKIDGDTFENITAANGEDEAFMNVHSELSDFLQDSSVSYIYTLRLVGNDMEFVVDSDPDEPGELGESYDVEPEVINAYRAGKAMALKEPYVDEWGELYSGYAPIKNSSGETVGIVAVDCSTDTVNAKLQTLLIAIGIVSVVCVVVAGFGGYILGRSFNQLADVAKDAKQVALGNLDFTFKYSKNDEIGEVCRTIENNNRIMKAYISDITQRLEEFKKGNLGAQYNVTYIGGYEPIKVTLDS